MSRRYESRVRRTQGNTRGIAIGATCVSGALAFALSSSTLTACGSGDDPTPDSGVEDSGAQPADGSTGADATRDGTAGDGGTTRDAGTDARVDGSTSSDASADARTDTSTGDGRSSNPEYDPPASCSGRPALKLTWFPSSGVTFDQPVLVTSAPGDRSRVFVVSRLGTITLVKNGTKLSTPFLDITTLVGSSSNSEAGLLGLAFHPNYEQNGRFFVYFNKTGAGNTTVVELARSSANADVASTTIVNTIFTVPTTQVQQGNHNGGSIAFGPDGYLYVSVGDGGSQGDPDNNAQSLSVKLGKILRFDVDAPSTPPPGNMSGSGVDTSIWGYGLRNPWRTSFDRKTGDFYIGDVGYSTREEIDVQPAGAGGLNYGWRCVEGTVVRNISGCATTGFVAPAADHSRSEASSIIGGYVYRGKAIPCLRGRYIYGDYNIDAIYSFVWNGTSATSKVTLTDDLNPGASIALSPTTFGEDADGELYIGLGSGRVYRIDAE